MISVAQSLWKDSSRILHNSLRYILSIYGIKSSYMKVTVPSLPEGASQVKFRAVKSICPGFM